MPITPSNSVVYRSPMVPAILVWRPSVSFSLLPATSAIMPLVLCGPASACSWTYISTSGLGMLVDVHQYGVVEQRAVAFRNRFELGHQIRELLHMPTADVAENALTLFALFSGRLPVLVGVVVVPCGSVAEPGEPGETLALG